METTFVPQPTDPIDPRHRFAPRPARRWLWRGMALLLVALVGLYVYQYVTRGTFWRGSFERYVSARAGRPVRVSGDFQLYFDPDLRFHAEGLRIANPGWAENDTFFGARRIDLDMSIGQLLFGHQIISRLVIDGGRMGLEQDAKGRNSWTFPGEKPLELPQIDRAQVTDTQLGYIDAIRQARVGLRFGDIAGAAGGRAVPGAAARVEGPLTFRGGGTAYGTPFTVSGTLTTPNQMAAGGRVGLDLVAQVADTRITLAGTLPGVTRFDGAALKVGVAGRNLQTPGKLFGIVLPATRPYALHADLERIGRDYRLTNIGGHFGDSDLAGMLRVTAKAATGDKLRLNGVLRSRVLDILDVGPFIGYSPGKLDAQGGKGAITIEQGRPRVLPDAPLAIEQLKNFDAHVDYSAAMVRTGAVPIANVQLGFYLEDQKLDLDPVSFDLVGGRLTSVIGINARVSPVVTEYDIRLSQVPLGKMLKSFKIEESGTTATMGGRLQLHGFGDTVRKSLGTASGRIALVFPKGTLWLRNIQLAKLDLQNFVTALIGKRLKKPTEIRCGVAAFTVRNGKAVADPVLFDTTRANYRVNGGFNFGDESLQLSLQGDSKEFSLFSGQSPIAINGWFAAPKINPISGKLIVRAAAAVALGVVATPVAAIAAFVDIGDAKSFDCGPVLAAKTAKVVDAAPKVKPKKKP